MDRAAAALAAICGETNGGARPSPVPWGGPQPRLFAAPASLHEASAVMRIASDHGLAVVFRGAGTKLAWGSAPRRCDLLVETHRLAAIIEHDAGDLIVRVQAGALLRDVQALVAKAGQQLAIDEVVPGSTVGGVVAAALAGPRRMLYGAPRDLILGITVVRADGAVAESGGRVVKNVAGYDLGKLFAGSYGTLGLIAEVILRLHPLPAATLSVSRDFAAAEDAARAARALAASQAVASAVELDGMLGAGSGITVAALLEGTPAGLPQRAGALCAILGPDARIDETPPPWSGRLPGAPGGALWKAAIAPGGLARFLAGLDALAAESRVPLHVRGSCGVGVISLAPDGGAAGPVLAALLADVRTLAAHQDGTVTVLGPGPAAGLACPWGPVRGLDLMRRVKAQFDPADLLAPGRFVGGI